MVLNSVARVRIHASALHAFARSGQRFERINLQERAKKKKKTSKMIHVNLPNKFYLHFTTKRIQFTNKKTS